EGKDALNAVGIGAWFNVADFGQMFTWHIALLPLAVAAIVALHVLFVRMHGVVPPIDATEADDQLITAGSESIVSNVSNVSNLSNESEEER
ncbi:MAG: hypothetical protein ACHQ06_06595, partial [Candidatus Dormibacteria bacterium]